MNNIYSHRICPIKCRRFIAIIFLKSKKTIHTNIYEMLMLATIFMISTFAYKHQKTHILIAFLVMFFMSKLKQVQGSYEE
ncbi:hypothetical protein B9Y46_11215 [Staphylococcus aureus]|uniref:hypothetical protein n=1 Tax=Staphylococcus aureus TaxID=1280 RepID=UPI000D12E5CE|nr:hypothetical protein [Staphylococcus aureus]MCQ1500983.1 hypothetical protein [Staphylococcus aureus]PSM69623.1 hypothetical protein B9Y46_11215 [Staphylococcus aureus]